MTVNWFDPPVYALADRRDSLLSYQGIPITSELAALEDLVGAAITRLAGQAERSGDDIYWSYFQDRQFDRTYATSSVGTALAQLGVSSTSAEWISEARSTPSVREA